MDRKRTQPRPCSAPRGRGSLRSLRLGRLLALGLSASSLLAASANAPVASAAAPRVAATQELALLLSSHIAHHSPAHRSAPVAVVAATRPLTGERTTLPVIGRSTGPGRRWLEVMLPGRPNGSTGWITQHGTRKLTTSWHITVDLARRRVTAYRAGRVVRRLLAVVGKPSTPTPTGNFFVEETVKIAPTQPGGPFGLATSARSDVLHEFDGGPGQIALHGRNNLGGTPGNAESHGCVRLDTANIDWLVARIEPGTPVTIYAG